MLESCQFSDDQFPAIPSAKKTFAAGAQLRSDNQRRFDIFRFRQIEKSYCVFPRVGQPNYVSLLLAGHTHCGQIVLPFYGPLSSVSRYGLRYNCGVIREDSKTLVVGAGLGTSVLPLRLGAVPDMWLLTLGRTAKP